MGPSPARYPPRNRPGIWRPDGSFTNLNQVPAPGTPTSRSSAGVAVSARAHAPGQPRTPRRSGAMARVLRPGGLLASSSRNWELVRDEGCGLRIGAQPVERDGRGALVAHGWSFADSWDDRQHFDIADAIVEPAGKVEQPRLTAGVLAVAHMKPWTPMSGQLAWSRPAPSTTPSTASSPPRNILARNARSHRDRPSRSAGRARRATHVRGCSAPGQHSQRSGADRPAIPCGY